MHRTFHIPEILDLIFAALQGFCPDDEPDLGFHIPVKERNKILGRGELAALARTCKTFCDPALDILWREQETLVNLLKCLPSHLWKEEIEQTSSTDTERTFSIIGSICSADWHIPLAYASRIQKLRLESWGLNKEISSVVDLFELLEGPEFPRDYLCPNLKKLSFDFHDEGSLYLHLFLGPNTVHIDLGLPFNSPTPSLPDLPIRYSELRTLHLDQVPYSGWWLHGPWDRFLCRNDISRITPTLNRVEDLALPLLDRAGLEHISRLPLLRSFRVETMLLADLGPPSRMCSLVDPQAPSFSALRDLHLVETTIEIVIEFLELLSDRCLVSFRVGTTEPVTRSTTRRLYAALARHLSHSVLQTLCVGLPEKDDMEMQSPSGDLANYAINGFIVATLFCFANLTEICLAPPTGFDLDDTVASDIAHAWPKVRTLSLTGSTHLYRPSSISLIGLTTFAKHCQELTSLSIGIDASTVPPSDDSTEIVSQFSLVYLDVDISPITNPDGVASFISVLLPNLAHIWTHREWHWADRAYDPDPYTDDEEQEYDWFTQWKQVEATLERSRKGASK
ncbi:hypothetical protein C8R45DRAFT_1081006 [Mycena sanguinolenta]|nr:hypothetical protein C8R45DRAFT_1081006 [Mycena sanguinolenta]